MAIIFIFLAFVVLIKIYTTKRKIFFASKEIIFLPVSSAFH